MTSSLQFIIDNPIVRNSRIITNPSGTFTVEQKDKHQDGLLLVVYSLQNSSTVISRRRVHNSHTPRYTNQARIEGNKQFNLFPFLI